MSYTGSGPPSRTGSASSRLVPGRASATSSRSTTQTKSSLSRIQATVVQKSGSGTKIQTQSRITATTITKVPSQASSSRQGLSGSNAGVPSGAARIRMASKTNKDPRTSLQTTKVIVTGVGLQPTGKTCKAKCANKGPADPLLQPFTAEVERGRPVPAGMYYIPISGAPDQGLGPEEKKLRQKLQKFTPTALSHWKVDANDPFARKPGPLKQVHPDIISGQFRAAQGTYEPEYANPQLEQRLDPSKPEQYWSVSLREAMSHESGVYEHENPDDGQTEQYVVENTVIERQVAADLPGSATRSSPGPGLPPSGSSAPPCPAPCARSSPGPRGLPPAGSSAPPCPAPCARSSPGLSASPSPCSGTTPSPGPQQIRPPCKAKCSKQPSTPLIQPGLPPNMAPQIYAPAISAPAITIQQPTPQVQPRIQSPCQRASGHPEFEHSVNVQMVPAPRMQSPAGEIDAQKTIFMQRLLQASPQGTKILTSLRGTNLVSPCQAKQIDIMKQENLPPPSPPRPMSPQVALPYRQMSPQVASPYRQMSPQVASPYRQMSPQAASPYRQMSPQAASPYRQMSPQLQYVLPPREERFSPEMRPSPGRCYPLPGPYASPPPSPLLTHRGQSPQGYTPPMYGMTAKQRSPLPMSHLSPLLQPTSPRSQFMQSPGHAQRPTTPEMGHGRSPCAPSSAQRPVMAHGGSPYLQVPGSGQRPVPAQGGSPHLQVPASGHRPVPAQGGSPYLQVPGTELKPETPIKIPVTPSKMAPPVTPIRLEAAAPVPLSPADASLDVVRRLVDEERQDVVISQELPPPLTRKLNKLKKKPQSMRVLEETLDQSVPIDEESETLKSDVIAELMYSQETGVINPASSPRKTYEQLFPPLEDEQPIAVSPAAPAPLHDIVVPMGEATIDSVAVVNEDIKEISEAVAKGTEEIPQANAFAEAIKNDTEGQLTSQSPPRGHKSREERPAEEEAGEDLGVDILDTEEGTGEEGGAEERKATPVKKREEGAEYIPRGEIEEQKAPWDINLGSLEDLVGGKMSMMSAWDNLPSDESVRATAGRLEYVLDVQKPLHHSCVQLRGSQMPAWFPGFYSVLPQVDGFVRLERTPSRAFASAWHVFAPYQSAEQSEVVIL